MDQLPQVDFHASDGVLLLLHGLGQLFQVDPVLQQGFGIGFVPLLQGFQISQRLLVFLGALLRPGHDGALGVHFRFQLPDVAGEGIGVLLDNGFFLIQVSDHALQLAPGLMILLGQLRHLAAVIVIFGLFFHAVQQLLNGLRYADGGIASASAPTAAASASAGGGLSAALQGIAPGIFEYRLVGVQAGARPGAGQGIPLRPFLGQGNGFGCPLPGGDQGLYGFGRQVLYADEAVGQG